ncbi:hypothetical protein AGABI2DRAFT_121415 [Agaricus bisporus var. bisporus H97]|uniref:hypothetical protein n=1 Tax=Agaricus bisporus var. bisporus (strain H97 / ATCC MYA-4626 / FGSC 10389) TaxID=936046 RepID=UPI00029F7A19|nr:hypothetical protein AGABI2DRAFT_121415 [Agaricus bisporus var. bisporus H97]EKV44235.1 hypothetical protein AGABI2DRAFT_121415 [Agaricus bisporus var. bisporus H97]
MDSNPTLQGDLLLITQLELIGSLSAAGLLYGIVFTLFCLYVHSSIPRLRINERKRQTTFMLAVVAIAMLSGLVNLSLNVWIIQDAFIKHPNFPGGPVAYEFAMLRRQSTICHICNLIVVLIITTIQVWRVWVIWSATRYAYLVVILPALCILAAVLLEIRAFILDLTLILPGGEKQGLKIGIAEFALHATIVIYCITLISVFLIREYRRHSKLIGTTQLSTKYMHIVAMLVESYAMETVWIIITAVLWAISHPTYSFFANTETYIDMIACVLVLYRVARGKTHESQKPANNPMMSALRWNRQDRSARSGTISHIGSGPRTTPRQNNLQSSTAS